MSSFFMNIVNSVAVVTFDAPDRKVNILDLDAIGELEETVSGLEEMGTDLKGAVFVSGKESNFIAGADLSLIEGITDPEDGARMARRGQEVFSRIAALPFTTVAAIHGSALGGGLELALACDRRVASDSTDTFMGLPETQLGIIPGFGGTQRLPRVVALSEAIRMITTGTRVYPERAFRIGLVNEVTKRENLLDAALAAVKGDLPRPPSPRGGTAGRVERFLSGNRPGRAFIFRRARKEVRAGTHGHYPAPLAAIDAMQTGLDKGVGVGLKEENRIFGQLAVTGVSKNLIRVFHLRENFARGDKAPASDIRDIAVIGAGAMGGGIAALAAERGMKVRLVDMSEKALGAALKALHEDVGKKRGRGRYKGVVAEWIPTRLSVDTRMRGMGRAQVVIEAVAERMDVKRSVFKGAAEAVPESSVILSNTSSLSVAGMAEGIGHPERVAGLHFFNPVDRMPLVEVIRTKETSDEVVERTAAFARRLGKIPIIVRDSPGFLVNRLLLPYLNGAVAMLEEGAQIQQVDKALIGFGMPMGAFILLDQVGADIAAHAAGSMFEAYGERMKPSPILETMLEAGRLGRKTGRGFYAYPAGGHRSPDAALTEILTPHIRERTLFTDEDIVTRLVYPMINEATLCLEEGVVDSPDAVDAAMIFGAGFPPFTGGLLRYADALGAGRVVKALKSLSEEIGPGYAPSETLARMAHDGEVFYP